MADALVTDGVQSGRGQPWASVAAQRPRTDAHGHMRLPSLPAFVATYLPDHPLATPPPPPPAPLHVRPPSHFAAPPPSALSERLWTRLVHALAAEPPGPAQLLFPPGPAAPSTPDDVLALLAAHSWSLEAAQKAVAAAAAASPRGRSLGPEYGPDRRGTPCAHIFRRGEAMYRCRCVHAVPSSFPPSIHPPRSPPSPSPADP